MKGVILEYGEQYYTDMKALFSAIKNVQKDYNWLITDCECYPLDGIFSEMLSQDYCWLSGEQLTRVVETENFQWIWAVLSGFKKGITLEEILKYNLPYADGYTGFWENPVSIQHPLADVEIVPWDSSLTLLISSNELIVENFKNTYLLSQDLQVYNKNL